MFYADFLIFARNIWRNAKIRIIHGQLLDTNEQSFINFMNISSIHQPFLNFINISSIHHISLFHHLSLFHIFFIHIISPSPQELFAIFSSFIFSHIYLYFIFLSLTDFDPPWTITSTRTTASLASVTATSSGCSADDQRRRRIKRMIKSLKIQRKRNLSITPLVKKSINQQMKPRQRD